jgi:hypothetical protein
MNACNLGLPRKLLLPPPSHSIGELKHWFAWSMASSVCLMNTDSILSVMILLSFFVCLKIGDISENVYEIAQSGGVGLSGTVESSW